MKKLSTDNLLPETAVAPGVYASHLLDPRANASISAAYHAIRIGTAEATFDNTERVMRMTWRALADDNLIRYRNQAWISALADCFSELYCLGLLIAKPASVTSASLIAWVEMMLCPDPMYRAIRIRGVTHPFFTPMSHLCDMLQRNMLIQESFFNNAGAIIREVFFKIGDSDEKVRAAVVDALNKRVLWATMKLLEREEAGKDSTYHIKLLAIAHNNLFVPSVKGAKITKQVPCIKSLITLPRSNEAKLKKPSTNLASLS